jgi:hypothetical protein
MRWLQKTENRKTKAREGKHWEKPSVRCAESDFDQLATITSDRGNSFAEPPVKSSRCVGLVQLHSPVCVQAPRQVGKVCKLHFMFL